jgi:hypothetical protein
MLTKILACLDLSTLRMSRLVCRAFRNASIHHITRLWCNYLMDNVPVLLTPARLAHGLSVFSVITELHLLFSLPRDASTLVFPAVLSRLHSLTLGPVGEEQAVSCSWEAIVPRLAGSTLLTSLTFISPNVQIYGFKFADSLRAFTALEDLELRAIPAGDEEELGEAVSELPRLRTLRILVRDDRFMDTVVRNASRMTRLQALEWCEEPRSGQWEHLALLTQLTFLSMSFWANSPLDLTLTPLSRLTSIQVLRLPKRGISMDQLHQVVSPMTRLQELQCSAFEAQGLDPLLASLPMMTKLDLRKPFFYAAHRPLPNGFASLHAVSLDLFPQWREQGMPSDVVQLAEAFTGLESLKLTCIGSVAHAFLSHLPCLRNLTELEYCRNEYYGLAAPAYVSLGLLAELQHLKRLSLVDALDCLVWNDEVRYLAALTGLTDLCIRQCPPAQPLTSAQVQPLTTLTRLEQLFSCKPWGAAFDSSGFKGALHGRQYELGLPCTYIGLYEPHTSLWPAECYFRRPIV